MGRAKCLVLGDACLWPVVEDLSLGKGVWWDCLIADVALS